MNYMKRFVAIVALLGTAFLFPAFSSGVEGTNQRAAQAAVSARAQHLQAVNDISPLQPALTSPQCCDLPGDANNDETSNIGDAVYLMNYIFKGGEPPPCLNEGDANGDCVINIADIVYILRHIFMFGPAPVCGCVTSP